MGSTESVKLIDVGEMSCKDTIIWRFLGFLSRTLSKCLRRVSSLSRAAKVFFTSSRACLQIVAYCERGTITLASNLCTSASL